MVSPPSLSRRRSSEMQLGLHGFVLEDGCLASVLANAANVSEDCNDYSCLHVGEARDGHEFNGKCTIMYNDR